MNTHAIHAGIVADGCKRAHAGEAETLERRIQRIEQRYERMKERAPWAARWVIMHRMRRRIRRARASIAPDSALYLAQRLIGRKMSR